MAKPLHMTGYAPRLPIRQAGPMPQLPQASQVPQAISRGLKQVTSSATQAVGSELERKRVIDNMIYKRQLANQLRKAEEEWKEKQYELKLAQDERAQEDATRKQDKADMDKDVFDREEKHYQRLQEFNKGLMEGRKQSGAEGHKFSKMDAENLAESLGIAGTPEAQRIMNRLWPTVRQTSGDRGRGFKQDVAGRSIPYLESEFQAILDQISEVTQTTYEASRIMENPKTFVREMMQIPMEMRQQSDILRLEKEARNKMAEINEAKALAGQAYRGKNYSSVAEPKSDDMNAVMKRIDELENEQKQLSEEKKRLYGR